jgi:hypothetical protein
MNAPRKESTPTERSEFWTPALFCLIAVGLWVTNWLLLLKYGGESAERGQFGDMFGAVNALFTALAFAGLIYTAILQRRQLLLQQKDLAESGETQKNLVQKQIDAQRELFERQTTFLEEQRQKQVEHDRKLEQLRQDFEEIVEQRRKNRETQRSSEFANNVLRAFRFELESLSALYQKGMGSRLTPLKEGEILFVSFALSEDWMTVYNANAAHLGVIEGTISRKIITVYSLLKGLIEEYRINNSLISELRDLNVGYSPNVVDKSIGARLQATSSMAVQQAGRIKEADAALKTAYTELISTLDARGIA